MEEKKLKSIGQKAIRGAFSLTVRRIILLGINFITLSVVLAKIFPALGRSIIVRAKIRK